MNRTDFQQLAVIRIAEAQVLLASSPPMPDGAYYLAGYAVECALKACIAKMTAAESWPEKAKVVEAHSHDLEKLIRVAELVKVFNVERMQNNSFAMNWLTVKDWSETSRYERHSLSDASNLVCAVIDIKSGVLPWIKTHW